MNSVGPAPTTAFPDSYTNFAENAWNEFWEWDTMVEKQDYFGEVPSDTHQYGNRENPGDTHVYGNRHDPHTYKGQPLNWGFFEGKYPGEGRVRN